MFERSPHGPKLPEGADKKGYFEPVLRLMRRFRDRILRHAEEPELMHPDTLDVLRRDVEELPEGPHRAFLLPLITAIGRMDEEERKTIHQERVAQGTEVLSTKKENRDVLILTHGTMSVHLPALKEPIVRLAPEAFGELSAVLTDGRPTADAKAVSDVLLLRMPRDTFQRARELEPSIEKSLQELMEFRMHQTRSFGALQRSDVNIAQVLAELELLRMRADQRDDMEQEYLLIAAQSLSNAASESFKLVKVPAGKDFVRQGEQLTSVKLILSGEANIFRYGGRVGIAKPGDFIGNDAFTPSRESQFRVSAITDLQLIEIERDAFLILRPKVEKIVMDQRAQLLSRKHETVNVSSANQSAIETDEVLNDIHSQALRARHYVPNRSSGNDLMFECGRAEQVIAWLGVRGLLTHRGTAGWQVVRQTPEKDFILQRPGDAQVVAPFKDLVTENLRPAVRPSHSEDTRAALQSFMDNGLTFEQAKFLVARGIVPQAKPNQQHLEHFGRSFESILEALSYVAEWADKPEYLEERKRLSSMLPLLLIDTNHQIGITALLKDPATRDLVLGSLDDMLAMPDVSDGEFRTVMTNETKMLREQYRLDAVRWNGTGATLRTTALKARLLTDPDWKDLYKLDLAEPSPSQSRQLHQYVNMLDADVCPSFVKELEELFAPMRSSGDRLPLVTGRTKSAEGVLDKLRRVKNGNRGKEAKREACLADLPDIVGARVIVPSCGALEEAMGRIEGHLQGRIYEKDDFYGNPRKQQKPYRLVTYTVECKGVPVEIQLQTLPSAIAAAIDHDIVYKPYTPASVEERALATSLQRRVALVETRKRTTATNGHGVHAEDGLSCTWRKPAAQQHSFQVSSSNGRLASVYVSETTRGWEADLTDARGYFQWQEGNGTSFTTHHGSSAIDSSSKIGMPQWREFRAQKLEDLKKRSKKPDIVDALHAEGIPLFAVEAFSDDLDVAGNRAAFLEEVKQRYAPQEYEAIERTLQLAEYAHQGQSYAIEKTDETTGRPKYPSSLATKDIPYANHCVQAARIAVRCGLSADGVQATLTHDTVEDTNVTAETLSRYVSPRCLSHVLSVTKRKKTADQDGETREEYMTRVAELKGEAKIIKAIDRYHNLLRAFNLRDSKKYLERIVEESRTIFSGDFEPNSALSSLALRYEMLLEAVDQLRQRTFAA